MDTIENSQTPQISSNSAEIGYIVGGSLKSSLRARLTVNAQSVQEGSFVVVESGGWQFYGLVTDLQLGATDPRFADEPETKRLPAEMMQLLQGKTLFANLEILPALMIQSGTDNEFPEEESHPMPVKTIPAHHAIVRLAHAGDIAEIFGKAEKKHNFIIGYTREQRHPVCINLDKFVQRSAGIFGATGTGKSFLTRIILAGLLNYNKSSIFVFDMHNEYAFDDIASDTNMKVTGLRSKFPGRVRVVGLGRGASIRNQTPDFNLELSESDIQPEDIELLSRELNLKETTPTTLEALVSEYRKEGWFHAYKNMKVGTYQEDENGKQVPANGSVAHWALNKGVNVSAAESLHSKLGRVFRKPYIVEQTAADSISEIIKALKAGQHVILSFGEHVTDLDYLLVSNLLTRRIRAEWEKMTNQSRSGKGQEPRPLIIVIEEAHKLLNREMASQTTFSTIAREMRKYFVTLLVIDQRPSQIYDEVLSQLGTRISGWLGDDQDIQAVLSGQANKDALRGMLARLQEKEEVLLSGWGVPMPLPVKSRRYDEVFWHELIGEMSQPVNKDKILKDLGFD